MKRLGFFSKFAETKTTAIRYASAGFAFAIVAFGLVSIGVPVWKEFESSFAYRDFKKYGVLGTYQRRFFGVFEKMSVMENLDRDNVELNQRVAELEKDFELERTRNASAEMQEITEELSDRIRDEAGTELARLLPAIPYNIPLHLMPHQQYALALGYFRKQEYEQAAVLFHHLLNMKEDTSYQRGEVQLLSAVAWYHLKNYKLTKHYLRSVAKGANQNTSLYRTAVLWEAILAKAEGKRRESQRYLTVALAQFPHSNEASWINRSPERKLAGRQEREPNQALFHQQELKETKGKTVEISHDAHQVVPAKNLPTEQEVDKHE